MVEACIVITAFPAVSFDKATNGGLIESIREQWRVRRRPVTFPRNARA